MKLFVTTTNFLETENDLTKLNIAKDDKILVLYSEDKNLLNVNAVSYFLKNGFEKEFLETTKDEIGVSVAFYLGKNLSNKKYDDVVLLEKNDEFSILVDVLEKNKTEYSILKGERFPQNFQKTPGKRGRKPGSTKKTEKSVEKDMIAASAVAV